MQTTQPLYTPAEVGRLIGRSRASVYRLINAGHIDVVHLTPAQPGKVKTGAVRITPDALQRFVDGLATNRAAS